MVAEKYSFEFANKGLVLQGTGLKLSITVANDPHYPQNVDVNSFELMYAPEHKCLYWTFVMNASVLIPMPQGPVMRQESRVILVKLDGISEIPDITSSAFETASNAAFSHPGIVEILETVFYRVQESIKESVLADLKKPQLVDGEGRALRSIPRNEG